MFDASAATRVGLVLWSAGCPRPDTPALDGRGRPSLHCSFHLSSPLSS